jgi:hypothetical protein
MVAIWDFLTHNGKLTGTFRFLSVLHKKKRENLEKQKKWKKRIEKERKIT